MKVLIIGGVGFIGSVVVCYIIENIRVLVVNIDKFIYVGNVEFVVFILESE